MPFALIVIGVLLFVTGMKGTWKQFGGELYTDLFTGSPSFVVWFIALLVVGMIGYIPGAKKPADAFMALIIVAMVLKNGGLFQNFQAAISQGPDTSVAQGGQSSATAASSGANSVANQATNAVNSYSKIFGAAAGLLGGGTSDAALVAAMPASVATADVGSFANDLASIPASLLG